MSVKNGLIIAMVPAGGFAYEQPLSNGKPQRLEASGYDELEDLVLKWRLQHLSFIDPLTANLDNVRDDIRIYICKVSPQNCLDKGTFAGFQIRQPLGNRTDHVPTIHRLNAWFALVQKTSRIEYAPAATAEGRADICRGCRQNVAWASDMCPPCNAAVYGQSQQTRGSRNLAVSDKPLGACRLYGHLNEAAVWLESPPRLDENTLPNVKPDQISPRCWMRQQEPNPEVRSDQENGLQEPGTSVGSSPGALRSGGSADDAESLPMRVLREVASDIETAEEEFERVHGHDTYE